MKEAILIFVLVGMLGYGYFWMGKLDLFLRGHRKSIEKTSEAKAPSCVVLTETMSDEEITEEIRRFRAAHPHTCVVLYDTIDADGLRHPEHKRFWSHRKK